MEWGGEGRGQMGREQRKVGGCGEEVHGWGISSNSYSAREKQRKSDEREQERMEMEKTKKKGKRVCSTKSETAKEATNNAWSRN